MKKNIVIPAAALIATLTAGCFRQDIRTFVVNVPQMGSPECSKIIQDALINVEGIHSADPDLHNKSMTITFDSRKLAIKNIEYLIADRGFDANEAQGNPEARAALPPACR
jgi:copper chaperone CopZ